MTKTTTSKGIIRKEFERKREEILRMKQLDIVLEKRHLGLDDFKKGDMKSFVKGAKLKLRKQRQINIV